MSQYMSFVFRGVITDPDSGLRRCEIPFQPGTRKARLVAVELLGSGLNSGTLTWSLGGAAASFGTAVDGNGRFDQLDTDLTDKLFLAVIGLD